ncbi:MAG: Dam family site-specific DNA-(adenine-N6)-methyltransferase [Deltaproteobacteria bacterium]|jgi:DNA adenine methylase|nr:Dam family site-specific DNA-(adenine-N6)-methyltransferase [Deltaproteobacteria bacterium]
MIVKPFVKWVGGKGQLINIIHNFYPTGMGTIYKKYAEPFIGGGAVLFDILSNYFFDEIYISDVNKELINAYKIIKSDYKVLISQLKLIQDQYHSLDIKSRSKFFYQQREKFNNIKSKNIKSKNIKSNAIISAVLFIFLNKTCYNGLYRVNKQGLFNVPAGTYKRPLICDDTNLYRISQKLQNVVIKHASYEKSLSFIDSSTFVYLDPPYRPLNSTSYFTSYDESNFNDKSQINLSKYFDKITQKGAVAMLSNSDPKNNDINDDFFDLLYNKYNLIRIKANRLINRNSDARGQISEILVTNY